MSISWARFYQQFRADLKLWCYFVCLQQICRLYYIYSLRNYLASDSGIDLLGQAMLHGLRFDALWATVWILVALLFFTLPSLIGTVNSASKLNRYRQYLAGIFTACTATIYSIHIEYFREYKDLFNQFVFGILYDDRVAIAKTILAEHHVGQNFATICVVLWLYVSYIREPIAPTAMARSAPSLQRQYSLLHKIILSCMIGLFYVIGFRGSIGPRPIQLKDAGVTQDPFLNKAIVSPYSALKYACKKHYLLHGVDNCTPYTSTTIKIVAKDFFKSSADYNKLSAYMEKITPGSKFPVAPKHIFLIIGESLDAWPLQEKFRAFNLTPKLLQLSADGLALTSFLPCAHGTMGTLNGIISGLPDFQLNINYQKSAYAPYPTAIALQFNKLGFTSNFFYGGYLSWQRLEDFAQAQGFSKVYGAAHINRNWQQTNEWGVDDKALFDFVTQTIATATAPTFNVIMTTSNHPPYSINLAGAGFDIRNVTEQLKQYPTSTAKVKELGHIWYADKTIAQFIDNISRHDSTALFAITGDHYGRKHILPNPPLFDTSAVPLILSGNNIRQHYKFGKQTAGSHLNIAATLLEMAAPKGFAYCAFAPSLFSAPVNTLGIGEQRIVTEQFIASTSREIMYLNNHSARADQADVLHSLIETHNQAVKIAWWLIKKGDNLE